ncbi:unnamed protein product [Haemonchus placei]|uniref:Uncharacterized protein n=1 Tax=Haemonchus placei TaxID=6290 RepID=A0A0N4W915_HAEPC|nr:unnamed protein product [Haemonchus placei]
MRGEGIHIEATSNKLEKISRISLHGGNMRATYSNTKKFAFNRSTFIGDTPMNEGQFLTVSSISHAIKKVLQTEGRGRIREHFLKWTDRNKFK